MSELSALCTEWSWNPGIVLPLLLSGGLYARGYWTLERRSRRAATALKPPRNSERTPSGFPARSAVTRVNTRGEARRRLQALLFCAGWIALALSLVSPLHALSETLFSMHMVQHELLMTVAAPLLVLGRPFAPMVWALPRSWRTTVQRLVRSTAYDRLQHAVTRPAIAWILYGLTLWTWHAPALFQFALRYELAHALQHSCFLFTALLFWNGMLAHRAVAQKGVAILYLFTTAVHTSILGALITFDSALWYPLYGPKALAVGILPLADQRWAGLIMWIPGSVPYLVGALGLVVHWMRDSRKNGWTPAGLSRSEALPGM